MRRFVRRPRPPLNEQGSLKMLFASRGVLGPPATQSPLAGIIAAIADRCYACDQRASGTRDRRAEGGRIERACARHADGAR